MPTLQSWQLAFLAICHAELGEMKQAQNASAKVKVNWAGQPLEEIITTEVGMFKDSAVLSRFRAILLRVDRER